MTTQFQQLKAREYGLIESILLQMERDNIVPSVVVGLTRGGLIPAVIISHALHIPVIPITWSTRDHVKREVSQVIVEQLLLHTENGPILIVDDICDSGESFSSLQSALPVNITTKTVWAALYQRKGTQFKASYVGTILTSEDWIDFSWEMEGAELASRVESRDDPVNGWISS